MVIPIKLELERSEYRGQFNFPNFEASLKALLQKFETEVRKDKELNKKLTKNNINKINDYIYIPINWCNFSHM